jgi:integrase
VGSMYKRQRADGSEYYSIRYKDADGSWRSKSCGRYKKDAEAVLRRVEEEVASGVYAKSDTTFEEVSQKWLKDVARHNVKPSTYDRYAHDVNYHLSPTFGRMKLTSITAEKIQSFVSEKIDDGCSPRSVVLMLKMLGAVMKWAVANNYIGKNPVTNVKRPRVSDEEMDFLTADEVNRLLAALPDEHRALFATAVMSGLRQGELLALRWTDFDPERGVLFVSRTYHPDYGFGAPKSQKGRRAVQMSPELVGILEGQRSTSIYDEPDDLIFPNHVGKPLDYRNVARRVFDKALDQAGLRRIRFHDLRHTYAALMISLGCNIKWLQRQMGHASLTTTMDTYGHILPDVEEHIGGRLDALLFDEKVVTLKAGGKVIQLEERGRQ